MKEYLSNLDPLEEIEDQISPEDLMNYEYQLDLENEDKTKE